MKIVVNLDISFDIPLVGTFCTYQDKVHEIVKCTIVQEKTDMSYFTPTFTIFVDITPIDDEGDYLGEPVIMVKWVECEEM